jgi:fumarate hydratase, class II
MGIVEPGSFEISGIHDGRMVGAGRARYGLGMPAPEDVFRVEHDSMGPVQVPASAAWGAQTQRAVENFPVSGEPLDRRLVAALGLIKAEAARVNAAAPGVGAVDAAVGAAIAASADEVAAGRWDDEFPVDIFQTGSGTSSNMNANEVIAHLATRALADDGPADADGPHGRPDDLVHPNDQVNASQSSNDVFPSAVRLAAVEAATRETLPALGALADALGERAAAFAGVVKAGRTHLMDATPVTLGQEFGAYSHQVRTAAERIEGCLGRVGAVPLGGTAVGNGINAPAGFGERVVARLAQRTGLALSVAPDRFAAQGSLDDLVELSGHLRTAAVALVKIADDLRLLASGPNAGLGEIRLPDLQPGSSIMPGKVNPVVCEVVTQVGAQVLGNDAAVAFAGSQGRFELNTYQPLVARNLLESLRLLATASRLLAERCVAGIEADEAQCRRYAEASPAVATALNPALGYAAVADLVHEARSSGRSVRDLVIEQGLLDAGAFDELVDVDLLARPDRPPGG